MNSIRVKPIESVNGIKFGTSREEVRKQMGESFSEFKKSKFSKNTTDDFGFCHIYYDSDDNVEAFEIFDDVEVLIDDKVVFPADISIIASVINDLVDDGDGFISKSYSVGISMNEGNMECILFGKEGYYN